MDIYLIRHTAVDAEEGVCRGRMEVPLRATWRNDFTAVLRRMPKVEHVITSPATRCVSLAHWLSAKLGASCHIDHGWEELSMGAWEGTRYADIDRLSFDYWAANYWDIAPPGGESYCALHTRVSSALARLRNFGASRAAVISHAGPIRAALGQALNLAPARYPTFDLDFGSVSALRTEPDGHSVLYMNHLDVQLV